MPGSPFSSARAVARSVHEEQPGASNNGYVQVTTFKYVGPGAGNLSVLPKEEENDNEEAQVVLPRPHLLCCCLLVCLLLLGLVAMAVPVEDEGLVDSFLYPTTTTWTTMPPLDGIELKFRIPHVDYRALLHEENYQSFTTKFQYALSSYFKRDLVREENIAIRLTDKEEEVSAIIIPACKVDTKALFASLNTTSLESLAKEVAEKLATASGWKRTVSTLHLEHAEVLSHSQFHTVCGLDHAAIEEYAGDPTFTTPTIYTTEEILTISGASGPAKDVMNGVFKDSDRKHNGRPVYEKEDVPEVWLLYDEDRWYVTSEDMMSHQEVGAEGGWAYSNRTGLLSPLHTKHWMEFIDGRWQVSPDMNCDLSERKVVSTTVSTTSAAPSSS